MTDDWFNEVCSTCRNETLVHNDDRTNLGDPGFICAKCEAARDHAEAQYMEGNPRCQNCHTEDTKYCEICDLPPGTNSAP